jgi:hypothetical protein
MFTFLLGVFAICSSYPGTATASDLSNLQQECSPYIKGSTSVDRENDYQSAISRSGETGGAMSVTALGGAWVVGASVALGPVVMGGEALAAAGVMGWEYYVLHPREKRAMMTRECLQKLYPNEFGQSPAMSTNFKKEGSSAVAIVEVQKNIQNGAALK